MPAELFSLAAEQAVIGALMLDSGAWTRITGIAAADFYRPDHKTIFDAIAQLAGVGKPFDMVVLEDYLDRRGHLRSAGGLAYLGTLAKETPGTANIEAYAATVRDWSLRRRLKDLAVRAERAATEGADDGDAILQRTLEQFLALQTSARIGRGLVSSSELVADFIDDIDGRNDGAHGLSIGLQDFDEITNGLDAGDLVVLAARPGMGKTAVMVSIAAYIATSRQVAVFSAEMPSRQIMRRHVSQLSSIPQGRLRTAKELTDAEWAEIAQATGRIAQLKLHVDDTSAPTMAHVRSECTALKARAGLELVIVDYLQLLRGNGMKRYEELRDVAYGLKALAKDLQVPVIALAQLNRGVESRDSKRPNASDLRDSGAIEEAADIIGMLFSESYYDPEFAMRDVLECNIVKHRNGERGQCLWSLVGAHSRVSLLDVGDRHQYRILVRKQHQSRGGASDDL